MRFIYKTLLDENEKKEERDGMQREMESGRYASNPDWHVLRNSRSINQGKVVLGYKYRGGVSESIHSDCFKKKITRKRMNLLIKCL
jgi:hypothetical protein